MKNDSLEKKLKASLKETESLKKKAQTAETDAAKLRLKAAEAPRISAESKEKVQKL